MIFKIIKYGSFVRFGFRTDGRNAGNMKARCRKVSFVFTYIDISYVITGMHG
jgi:hypothetical protein